jgi:hypothetical protein
VLSPSPGREERAKRQISHIQAARREGAQGTQKLDPNPPTWSQVLLGKTSVLIISLPKRKQSHTK